MTGARMPSATAFDIVVDHLVETPDAGFLVGKVEVLERHRIEAHLLRLGKLEIGETSVVISVASPHRKAAFVACEWLIVELKRTVPIFKKEVYAHGEHWVEGDVTA